MSIDRKGLEEIKGMVYTPTGAIDTSKGLCAGDADLLLRDRKELLEFIEQAVADFEAFAAENGIEWAQWSAIAHTIDWGKELLGNCG